MIKINVILPEIEDIKAKEEIRKALLDIVDQINRALTETDERLKELEAP